MWWQNTTFGAFCFSIFFKIAQKSEFFKICVHLPCFVSEKMNPKNEKVSNLQQRQEIKVGIHEIDLDSNYFPAETQIKTRSENL